MFSEPSHNTFSIQALMIVLVIFLASTPSLGEDVKKASSISSQSKPDRETLIDEFTLNWTELQLAKRDSPYLVLNIPRSTLDARLKGRLLRRFPITFKMSEKELNSEIANLRSPRDLPVEVVTSKRLYGYKKCYSDSVLRIIANVIRIDPETIQRYMPSRFELRFGRRLVIYVETDVKPSHRPGWKAPFLHLRSAVLDLFAKAKIKVQVNGEDALTLYRMAEPGTPMLIRTRE